MEFLIGQHSLFLAGMGQSFFYLHQFKPWLPAWIAGPLFLLPWAVVFFLFYHDRPLFSARTVRRGWFYAAAATAFFTILAEATWILGYMPPPTVEHRLASDVLVQVLMNLGWLSFVPMIRDRHNHPELWS